MSCRLGDVGWLKILVSRVSVVFVEDGCFIGAAAVEMFELC